MRNITVLAAALLLGLAHPAAAAPAAEQAAAKPPGPPRRDLSDEFFRDKNVPLLRIKVADKELDALRREPRLYVRVTVEEVARAGKDDGGGAAKCDKCGDCEKCRGGECCRTTVYRDVAAHLKGAAGSFRGVDERPAWTLDFEKLVEGQQFHGMWKLHLNNSVQDGSYMHETLCGELYRAAGVPTPRGRVVLVELNGKKQGLYVLKEGFDEQFLKRYFKETGGNLYDGGFLTDVNQPLKLSGAEGEEPDRADLKALVAAAEEPDPAKRWERLQKVLDVDRFISLVAMEVITWHWDGYAMKANNYRVYHDPKTKKMTFFAHGMDQMFADPGGPLLPDMGGLVARQLLDTKEGRRRYVARVRELLDKVYVPEKVAARVDELKAVIKPALAQTDENAAKELDDRGEGIRHAVAERVKHLRRELEREGKRE